LSATARIEAGIEPSYRLFALEWKAPDGAHSAQARSQRCRQAGGWGGSSTCSPHGKLPGIFAAVRLAAPSPTARQRLMGSRSARKASRRRGTSIARWPSVRSASRNIPRRFPKHGSSPVGRLVRKASHLDDLPRSLMAHTDEARRSRGCYSQPTVRSLELGS
jgi:hypothetical protein